ncbi:MAG: tetratricopeptide repeat protein [Lentimicrobiaceae bacterium]|jgi:tetratricopeptide (TPR) repeat protein|nr:tetratricopeptide repeat protein [Lentimicrobiaceae bacterium]
MQRKFIAIFILITSFFIVFSFSNKLQAQENQSYEQLMKSGNEKFDQSDFVSAKTYFEMALRQKEGDQAAQLKLNATKEMLRKQMGKQDVFYDYLDSGDRLKESNKLEEALLEYEKALKIFPDDQYTNHQVDEIKEFLAKEKVSLDSFEAAMRTGESLLTDKKFQEAVLKFQEALEIYPDRQDAKDKLREATVLLADFQLKEQTVEKLRDAAKQFVLRKNYAEAETKLLEALQIFPENKEVAAELETVRTQKEKAMAYDALITQADSYYEQKNFLEAKKHYQQSLSVWQDQTYPKDMIDRIDSMMQSDAYIAQQNYDEAIVQAQIFEKNEKLEDAINQYNRALSYKPDDVLATERIAALQELLANAIAREELEQQYVLLLQNAEKEENAGKIELALNHYMEASELKPHEAYPRDKVLDLQAQLQAVADEQSRKESYDRVVAEADQLFVAKQLMQAKERYTQALQLLVNQEYPQTKIREIDALLAEQAEAMALENRFDDLVRQGDEAFASKQFQNAIERYEAALELKQGEAYPTEQIATAKRELELIAQNEALNGEYNAVIKRADDFFVASDWENAIAAYNEAAAKKPSETYPHTQLEQIRLKQEALAAEASKQQEIERLTVLADEHFVEKNWTEAQSTYIQIIQLESTNSHANTRIAEIKSILEAAALELEKNYNLAMTQGDLEAEQRNYPEAIVAYQQALTYKPDDAIASSKLNDVQRIYDEKMNALTAEYNAFVAEADAAYKAKNYENAIEAYTKADQVGLDKTYPREMLEAISSYFEETKLAELNSQPLVIERYTTKRFEFEPINISDRRTNFVMLRARNTGTGTFPMIVSYGDKNNRNGGFVLPIPADNEYRVYIVRVGSQYKWFSEDNTWIEFSPENGDVEIEMIQISKGG